jgi:hypothetical protein
MRIALVLTLLVGLVAPALADKPVPSGKVKAYRGPEGELIVMLEVNKSAQVLVHYRKLGDDLDGKTFLYELEDLGDHGGHNAYVTKKRGSKTYRSYVLEEQGDGVWEFFHPEKSTKHFTIVYSEKDTESLTADDVMNAYHP